MKVKKRRKMGEPGPARQAASFRPRALAWSIAAACAVSVGAAQGASIAVDSLADDTLVNLAGNGTCDLREAIEAANTNAVVDACVAGDMASTDTIGLFSAPDGAINLTAPLVIDAAAGTARVSGGGQSKTVIDANGNGRAFDIINSGSEVNLNSVHITGGAVAGDGGCIRSTADLRLVSARVDGCTATAANGGAVAVVSNYRSLRVEFSTIVGNQAVAGGGIHATSYGGSVDISDSTVADNIATGSGGGLFTGSALVTISDSTISGNTATSHGGGIAHNYYYSSLTLTNSTVSGNTSDGNGGGLYINDGIVFANNSTIASNTAVAGGGVFIHYGGSAGVLTSNSSLIGDNIASGGGALSDVGSDAGASFNASSSLIENNSGLINGTDSGNVKAMDPSLLPLAFNGGETQTHALQPGSPAIDVGANPLMLTLDQRGFDRAFDDGLNTPAADIGAFESRFGGVVVNSTADDVDPLDGECTLREAIIAANFNGGMQLPTAGECFQDGRFRSSITFGIPGTGPHVIAPGTVLPALSGPAVIDATTQAGTNCVTGDLQVVLDGTSAGAGASGLSFVGVNSSVVRGLVIQNFNDAGIYLGAYDGDGISPSRDVVIQCNFIGTNAAGTAAAANGTGIRLVDSSGGGYYGNESFGPERTLIGGTFPGEGNVISGNTANGIFSTDSSDTRVFGNRIGTDKTGTLPLGNGMAGIYSGDDFQPKFGSTDIASRNQISNNAGSGVVLGGAVATGPTVDADLIYNRIENNAANGVVLSNDSNIATNMNNCITGNASVSGFGFNNTNTAAENVADNWWGAADGPSAPGGTGSGDSASTNVVFTPFDSEPFLTDALPGCTLGAAVDLEVSASDSIDPVIAGSGPDNVTVTFMVTNNGPDDANNVTLDLSEFLTFDVTRGTESPSTGSFTDPTWTIPFLANGASATLDIPYTAGPSAFQFDFFDVSLDVVDADEPLIFPGDDSATEFVGILTESDLSITKTDSADPVVLGDSFYYTITVMNNGPSDAQGVFVTETLPAEVGFASTSGCDEDPVGVPVCTLGTVEAGQMASYTVNVTADALAAPAVNTATVDIAMGQIPLSLESPPQAGPKALVGTGDDTVMEETTIVAPGTLTVTKTDSADPVILGDTFNYTVTVFNSGPGMADDVVVTDVLPAEVGLVSTSGCAEDPAGAPTCTLGSIGPGAMASYTINVTADSVGMPNNAASVATSTAGYTLVAGNETTDIVLQQFPLSVSKTGSGDGTVSSSPPGIDCGPSCSASFEDGTMVTLTAIADAVSTFVGFGGDPDCTDGVVTVDSAVNCTAQFDSAQSLLSVTLLGDGSGTVTSAPAGINCGPVCNATYTTGQVVALSAVPEAGSEFLGFGGSPDCIDGEVSLIGNTFCTAIFDMPGADIAVSVGESVDPVLAGSGPDNLTHTYTVTNNGPNPATDVVITGFGTSAFGRVFNPSVGAVAAGQWTIPNLAGGASETLAVSFTVAADAPPTPDAITTNAMLMSSDPVDATPGNNMASESTSIATEAQLLVSKTDSADPVVQFDEFIYTITVENTGPSDAQAVIADDVLPAGVTLQSIDGCDNDGPTPGNCHLGTIAAGESDSFTVTVVADQVGEVINVVTVTSSTPLAGTTMADETTTIDPLALFIEPEVLPVGQVGSEYFATFTLANGTPPDLFDIDPSELPPGLMLNGANLIGTPTVAGDFPLTVNATDSNGATGLRDYVLTVLPEGLFILTEALDDGVVNAPYSDQADGIGGETPYDWSTVTTLPDGLGIDPITGAITGTPTVDGTFDVELKLTDNDGTMTTRIVPLTIGLAGLVNLTPPLPPGSVGIPYGAPLLFGGAMGELTCMLVDGQLPPGVEIVAVEGGCAFGPNGVPMVPGTYNFQVKAEDEAGQMVTFPLRIRISQSLLGVGPGFEPPSIVPIPDLSPAGPGGGFIDESLQKAAVDAYGQTYLVGFSYNGSNYDLELLKVGVDGTLIWRRLFNGGSHDFGYGVAISPEDQTIYAVGYGLFGVEYQALMLRYSPNGELLSERKTRRGRGVDAFYDVAVDRDRVCAVGESYNGINFDGLIDCFDHDGDRLWQTLRITPDTETAYRIQMRACPEDPEAELPIVTTCTVEVGGAEGVALDRGWLLGLRPSDGAAVRTQSIPDMSVEGMTLREDGVVIGGTTAGDDFRVRRLDDAGLAVWTRDFADGDQLRAVHQDAFGNLFATGRGAGGGGPDGIVILVDPIDGTLLDSLRVDLGGDERLFEGLVRPDNRLVLAGQRSAPGGGNRFLLMFVNTGLGF